MNQTPAGQPSVALDRDTVEAVVHRALYANAAQVVDWQATQLTGGREAVSRIYVVEVNLRLLDNTQTLDWRVVLKIVRMTPERCSPAHWNYWLREAEAYSSGALADLPASFSAPRCYDVTIRADEVWIWLEYIPGQQDAKWTAEEIGHVAFELGCFNGSYLVDATPPAGLWAGPGWLRHYVTTYARHIERLPQLQTHPLVGRTVPPQLLPELLRLVGERERLLGRLDELPQVFCHQDIHRGNLILTRSTAGAPRLVAVDWSFASIAALGQDLAPLLFTNRRLPNVYDLVTRHYSAGLRAVGWQGDETMIRWSSATAAALIYGVAMIGLFIGNLLDEQKHAELTDGFGITIEQLPPRVTGWVEFGLHYAEVARGVAYDRWP